MTTTVPVSVAGVSFEGRQEYIKKMARNSPILIVPEPENPHDKNALAVYTVLAGVQTKIGYVPKSTAAWVAERLQGESVSGELLEFTGEGVGMNRGLNISFEVPGDPKLGFSVPSTSKKLRG